MPAWLRDLLLESPIPPSRWMPSRTERLADARLTLRRRFGAARSGPARPSHRLRDLGSAYPLASGTRFVSGESIEADLEADITSVNPPILQGWAYLLFVVAAAVALLGMGTLKQGGDIPLVVLELIGAPIGWLLALVAWGFGQRTIELGADGVHVRRWTDVWSRRTGRRLGPPDALRASLVDDGSVVLDGTAGPIRVGTRTWGSTARADLVDELPTWGVDCDFGRHHGHRRAAHRR
jgi:hypothetical protein